MVIEITLNTHSIIEKKQKSNVLTSNFYSVITLLENKIKG